MADQTRSGAAGEEGPREVAPRLVAGGGALRSRMRRVRAISLLIHNTARAIASKTAASMNQGHV
jgi:hypothetical protein